MNKVELVRSSKLYKVFKPFYSGCGHVIVFHRVCNSESPILTNNIQVTPEYLENVLKYFISSKIDIVTLDECYNRITSRKNVKRFVAFTFDDGYSDNMTHALPVFEKYNAPLAIFVATGYPEYKILFWGDLLEIFVLNSSKINFNDDSVSYSYDTLTVDGKRDSFNKIRDYIKKSGHENLQSRLKNVFGESYNDLIALNKSLTLTWEQLKELSNHTLVTIGSHTVNHLVLSKLTDVEVKQEILESVILIERKIGKPVFYLAYPYGGDREVSTREYNIAQKCNVKMAFTAKNGNVFKRHARYLTSIPRIGLNENWSIPSIDLYINGLTPFLNKFR